MASVRWLCVLGALLSVLAYSQVQARPPNLAGDGYVYEIKDGDRTCFYASFQLDFVISYLYYPNMSDPTTKDVMSKDIHLPNNTLVDKKGSSCGKYESSLELSWQYFDTICNASLVFALHNDSWYATFISFSFDFASLNNSVESGPQTYITEDTNLFTQHFSREEFFYCEKCKTFTFVNCSEESISMGTCVTPCPLNKKNQSDCNSTLMMEHSIIYPGDFDKEYPARKLCIEDIIALKELIVPIVVGGILGILLVLIFLAYIIAYIRRRRKEVRYERLGEATY